MSGNALCRIDDLSVCYATGDAPALQNVSLTIRQGQRLAIIGESGSGKSTLGRAIAGLLPGNARVSGDISWSRDSGLFHGRPLPGRDIGTIFQDTGATLNPVLTIGEQVAEGPCGISACHGGKRAILPAAFWSGCGCRIPPICSPLIRTSFPAARGNAWRLLPRLQPVLRS